MPEFRFDEKSHTYWLDGEKLISVTTVLREAKIFEYTGGHGMYMDRGTAVHAVTELDDRGALKLENVENPIIPRVEGWRKFKKETKIEILASEEGVYHPIYKYAGTLDRRVLWNGRESVIDIKTGLRAPWHALQTAAYAKCFNRPLLRFALYLFDDGTYELEEHKDASDWDVFRSALAVVNWKRRHNIVKV